MGARGCSQTRFGFYLILLIGLYMLGDTALSASEWLQKYMEVSKNANSGVPILTSSYSILMEEKPEERDMPIEQKVANDVEIVDLHNSREDLAEEEPSTQKDLVENKPSNTNVDEQAATSTTPPTSPPTISPTSPPTVSPTGASANSTVSSEKKHFLFVGDSTLRYALLEWLHQHYHPSDFATPDALIHEKRHDSWTAFFDYSTNHFSGAMRCDCQRSEVWNLGSEIENRYYKHKELMATFLQGYGDNMAHGRYFPPDEIWNATITLPPDANYTHPVLQKSDRGKSWGYMGEDWDRLFSEYASKLDPAPNAVVMGAGLWPNRRIAIRMGSILREALKVGSMVVWRGILKNRAQKVASPSEADVAIQDWQYRLPNIIYQPFPDSRIVLNESDYFDENHFSLPWAYNEWNKDLNEALRGRPMQHVAFLLEGEDEGDRSYERNLIRQLCAPPLCTSYVFTSNPEWSGLHDWPAAYVSSHKGSCNGQLEDSKVCWGKLLFNLQFEALVVFNTRLRWFFPAPTLKFFQDLNASIVWTHESYSNSENIDELAIITDRGTIFDYLYNNTILQKKSIPMGAVLQDGEGNLDCSALNGGNHSVLRFSCQLRHYNMSDNYGQPHRWSHRNNRTFCLGHEDETRLLVNRTCSDTAVDQMFVGSVNGAHGFDGSKLSHNLTVPSWFNDAEIGLNWYREDVEVYSLSMAESLRRESNSRH